MSKIIHKSGPQRVEVYSGFGQYEFVPAPRCAGSKGVYSGKTYLVTRLWKNVTCKHCLKHRDVK